MRCIRVFLIFLLSHLFYENGLFGQPSYRVNHKGTDRYFTSRKSINTHDGGTVITGKTGFQERQSQAYVMKLDRTGRVKWAKKVETTLDTYDFFLTELGDGSIVFAGNSQSNGAPVYSDITLIRFTCEGDILWSKNISTLQGETNRFLLPFSLKTGRGNDVILSYYGTGNTNQYVTITRINESGNAVWSNTFYGTDNETRLPTVAFLSGNSVVAIGMKSYYTNFYNYYKSFFAITIDYASGTVQATKGFDYAEHITNRGVLVSHQSHHFYVEQLTNGGFAVFGEFSNFDYVNHYFFKLILDQNLSIASSVSYSVPLDLGKQWAKMRVFPNGEAHILSVPPNHQQLCWYAADENNNVVRQKRIEYPGANLDLWYAPVPNGNNAMNFIVSRMFLPEGSIEVTQLNNQSNTMEQCIGTDTSYVQLLPWTANEGNTSFQSIVTANPVITPLQLSTSDMVITTQYVCEAEEEPGVEPNQDFNIIGDTVVCDTREAVLFTGRTLNGTGKVTWTMSSDSYDQFEQLNDSTLSIVFKAPESNPVTVKLYASTESCEVLQDSIEITLYPQPETTVKNYRSCEFPLQLRAGIGYRSYQWPDGSSNETFTVSSPGNYELVLETYCGVQLTETITVEPANCSNTLFLPNAFSPNNDGKNDVFRPAFSGVPDFFEMIIYNRWGQIVFKTNNSSQGWDGRVRGNAQKSDLFVCLVRYRFPGGQISEKKVMITLVR